LTPLPYQRRGHGAAALLIHGWASDHRSFDALAPLLAREFTCWVPDLPGCGTAPLPETGVPGVETLAETLTDFADRFQVQRPLLIGHSLGALIALEMLARRPGRFAGAVGLDPAPIVKQDRLAAQMAETLAALRKDPPLQVLAALRDQALYRGHESAAVQALITAMAADADPDALTPTFADLLAWPDRADLSSIADPVLIIEADRPQNRQSDLIAAIPHIRFGRTVGHGHFHHLLAADQIAPMIRAFRAVALR